MSQLSDKTILYQLDQVDQGGDIMELFEDRLHYLAKEWGYEIEEDEASPYYGSIRLPDGRHADLTFESVIHDG